LSEFCVSPYTTDELGRITTYSYDADNRRIKSTDALNQQRGIVYDAVGNIVSQTDELGRTTNYTYDAVDRQIGITDALGHATTYTYDAAGNRLQVADALGQTTKYVYDGLNRQTQVIDAKNQTTRTGYDAVGNILAITDAVGNITRYTYDALDRQITDTNSLGKTRSFGYDAVGDLISSTDRNGRNRTYTYDALNRQTAENWLDNAGDNVRTFTYGYDAVGHLLTTNDPDSKYTYTYDLVDRITAVDNFGTAGVPNVLLNYSYDAAGNLLSVADKIDGVQKGTNAYTYDLLNRVTRITQSGTGVQSKRVDMTYDAVNQMTGLSRYGDLAGTLSVADSSYSYDLVGRLTNLEYKRGTSTLASYGLVYDAANRITKSSGTDGVQDYTYDSTNQLTGADHTTQADEAYSYDANGNRTNAGYGNGTNNRLLTDGVYNYQYDDEGNRTRRVEIATGSVTEYVWDYRNRLTSVLFKDGAGVVTKTIEYLYDVSDRRIGKSIDGAVAERYVYDGSNIALVFDGAGSQTHRYLYGTGVDTVLADERGGAVVWALADNQGTIRDLVDGNGTILNHITYDSFGKIVSQSNASVEFRYGYTGREQDAETGLDYYRARYYDAVNGRFISEDPIGFNAGDGNLYRYVGNSPTNFVDPSGNVGNNVNPLPRVDPNCLAQKPKEDPCKDTLINRDVFKNFIANIKNNKNQNNWKNPKLRQQIIQNAINQATDGAGLPRVKIAYKPISGSNAEYDVATNTINITNNTGDRINGFPLDELGFDRLAGLAYHEARHMEQYYRITQYVPSTFKKVDQIFSNKAANNSIPGGRKAFAESMRGNYVDDSIEKVDYYNERIEQDAYVLNQAIINELRRGNKTKYKKKIKDKTIEVTKETYRDVFENGDIAANKGRNKNLDEYDCLKI
jgi:RHS repeat-associated protein